MRIKANNSGCIACCGAYIIPPIQLSDLLLAGDVFVFDHPMLSGVRTEVQGLAPMVESIMASAGVSECYINQEFADLNGGRHLVTSFGGKRAGVDLRPVARHSTQIQSIGKPATICEAAYA